jgi:hypothetical protein
MDHNLEKGAYIPLSGLFGRDAYMMHIPACWQRGVYSYGSAGAEPTCSMGDPHAARWGVDPANHRLDNLPPHLR